MPARLRCAYVDLDETLLGAGASLLRDGDGDFSLLGARALEACARADVELVIYSGRRRSSLWHDARLLGVRSYAFEAGAGLVLDGELHWLAGPYEPRDDATIFDQIGATGAPALLLERFDLVYHDPWHLDREVSHLFRGIADTAEAENLLRQAGHEDLRLLDNGASARPRLRAGGVHRGRRLARGHGRGRGGRHVLARRQRRRGAARDSAAQRPRVRRELRRRRVRGGDDRAGRAPVVNPA